MKDTQIYFFIGTTAELIKLAPIIRELKERSIPFKVITSGQNVVRFHELKNYIGNISVYYAFKQRPIGIRLPLIVGFIIWSMKALLNYFLFFHHELRGSSKTNTYFIVHGDTVSSLLGALISKIFRVQLVHIESGLRSFNFIEPFPEEICRHIISKLADIHFCPNSWCIGNLNTVGGEKINTYQNTLIETFTHAMRRRNKSPLVRRMMKNNMKYFVLVIHRQEHVLFNKSETNKVVESVFRNLRRDLICIFVVHDLSIPFIQVWREKKKKVIANKIIFIKRIDYLDYMHIFSNAEFVVTDGGSNQEEMYYMGKPCLLLRKNTERIEGLDENVVLSKNNSLSIQHFIQNYQIYVRPKITFQINPASIIVNRFTNE